MKQLLFFLFLFASANSLAQKTKEESATEKFVLKLHENKFRWKVIKQFDSLNAILDERVQIDCLNTVGTLLAPERKK